MTKTECCFGENPAHCIDCFNIIELGAGPNTADVNLIVSVYNAKLYVASSCNLVVCRFCMAGTTLIKKPL